MSNAHLHHGQCHIVGRNASRNAARKEVPAVEHAADRFVTRTLDQLELPCRYSVVYELTRIECLLSRPAYDDEYVAQPLGWLRSISA